MHFNDAPLLVKIICTIAIAAVNKRILQQICIITPIGALRQDRYAAQHHQQEDFYIQRIKGVERVVLHHWEGRAKLG